MTINILMPMAGQAKRFKSSAYQQPKPLIPLKGKRLFQWAVHSLKDIKKNVYPILLRKYYEPWLSDDYFCTLIDQYTQGPVQTAYQAIKSIDLKLPLIVLDCDLTFYSQAFNQMLINGPHPQGALVTFNSSTPHFSYARIDNTGKVIDVREKEVISQNAIAGCYFFCTGEIFEHYARQSLKMKLSNHQHQEYYVSHLYQLMLKDQCYIKAYSTEKYRSLGTPEEIEQSIPHIN